MSEGVLYVDVVAAVVVCSNVPPDAAVYQRKVPEEALLAPSATVPGPHKEAPVTVGAAGAMPEFMNARTCTRALVHPPLSNST